MGKRVGKTVSVIVPVYNGERYLARCLESILGQTWEDMEILLVDDGSTDGSAGICDGFSEKDKRVRTVHTENKGVSSARNLGMELCKGDYIAFVDADDLLAEDMVEHLADLLEKTGCDVAGCGFRKLSAADSGQEIKGGVQESARMRENPAVCMRSGQEAQICLQQAETLSGLEFMKEGILKSDTRCWSKLYRKESIGTVRFIEGLAIGEDMLFLMDLAKAGNRFARSSYKGYGYWNNDGGAMMRRFRDSYMDQITCWERALPVLTSADPGLTDKAEAVLLVSAMLVAGKLAALTRKERKEKRACAERCLRLVREYGSHKGAFRELDGGYRIKVLMYRYMPEIYMGLYGYSKRQKEGKVWEE